MKFIDMCEKYNSQGRLSGQCGSVLHKYLSKMQYDIINDYVSQGKVLDERQGDILTLVLADGTKIHTYEEYSKAEGEYFKIYIEKETENTSTRLIIAYDQFGFTPYETTGLMETEDNLYLYRYFPLRYDDKNKPDLSGSTELLSAIYDKKELSNLNSNNIIDLITSFYGGIDLEFLFDKNEPTSVDALPVVYSYSLGAFVNDITEAAFDIENRFNEISVTKKKHK